MKRMFRQTIVVMSVCILISLLAAVYMLRHEIVSKSIIDDVGGTSRFDGYGALFISASLIVLLATIIIQAKRNGRNRN